MLAHVDIPTPLPPSSALEILADARYSFCFVDVGLTNEDLFDFSEIAIQKNLDLNQLGESQDLEEKIAFFLAEIGPNSPDVCGRAAKKIFRIVSEIMDASGRMASWISLRASMPNSRYDVARWHLDPHYYLISRTDNRVHYKFALTLLGPSTLFSPIPRESSELRAVIFEKLGERQFLSELCALAPIVSPPTGVGAYFLRGTEKIAAIHSEPKYGVGPRLFLSIVPCEPNEIEQVRSMVRDFYRSGRVSLNDP